ncbi:MAG: divergent polysaccharide deacetylase family protein [Brevirhabdus sp.]
MLRGFLSGALSAGVLSVITMAVVSLSLPLPVPPQSTSEVDVPAGSEFKREKPDEAPVIPATDPEVSGEASGLGADTPETEPAPVPDTQPSVRPDPTADAPLQSDQQPAPEGQTPAAPSPSQPLDDSATDVIPVPSPPGTEAAPSQPAPPSPPAAEAPPKAPGAPQGDSAPVAPPVNAAAPTEPPTSPAMPKVPAAPTPPQSAEAPPEAPITLPVPDTTAPVPQNPVLADDSPRNPVLAGQVRDEDAAGVADAVATADGPDGSLPAYQRFAAPFGGAGGKPVLSLVLIVTDEGGAPLDTLAALDIPVTFLVDPDQPEAAETAQVLRAAGMEYVIQLPSFSNGSDAQSVEVTMEALHVAMPEAIGYADRAEGGLASSRAAQKQVMSVLAQDGHALLLFDRGLNAAQSAAEREGVPATLIFRELDSQNERAHTIRRYLDRAAFKAGQDGHAVMIGHSYPETISALVEWALDGRAEAVALAPLSAVFDASR